MPMQAAEDLPKAVLEDNLLKLPTMVADHKVETADSHLQCLKATMELVKAARPLEEILVKLQLLAQLRQISKT